MTKGPMLRGECPACGRFMPLRKNGKLIMHLPRELINTPSAPRYQCPGSSKPPKK